jgi:hypothetical protein
MTSKRSRRGKHGTRKVSPADAAEALPAMAATEPGDVAASAAAVSRDGSAVVTGSVISTAAAANGAPVTAFVPDNAVVRRTKDGWRVGSDDLPDLTCAMILADLLAAENGLSDAPPAKPACESAGASETGRLRATVGQLEHALATRIRVEQAIGVLAERHRIKPRQAFEQLREAARSRGRKVIDIAGDVVASATNPLLQLPDELSRPRSGPRRGARQPSGAQ